VPGHIWPGQTFAYEWQADSATLTNRYIGLLERAKQLVRVPSMSAAIYTELSDVQQELNGLTTYDREVIKVDLEKVRAANEALIQSAQDVIVK
jgi:hypothetical protein